MRVVIMVGIPGSGKSTAVKNIKESAEDHGLKCVVVCPDDIREELTGDASDQSKNSEVWSLAYSRAKEVIDNNAADVLIFDSTAVSRADRARIVGSLGLPRYGVQVTCVFLDTPFESCCERNSSRERKVPTEVLQRMSESLENPCFERESYLDEIEVIGM